MWFTRLTPLTPLETTRAPVQVNSYRLAAAPRLEPQGFITNDGV